MPRVLPLLLCAFLCVVSVRPSWAQFESGSVVGTVRDTTGGVVAKAAVTLLSPDPLGACRWASRGISASIPW